MNVHNHHISLSHTNTLPIVAYEQQETTNVLSFFVETGHFILKGVTSCNFALCFFTIFALSKKFEFAYLPRYDLILIMAISVQFILIWTKQEQTHELKAICVFHLLGLALEGFKVHPSIGSWVYPEFAYAKILGLPLYTGFMYASVASFMIQFWRKTQLYLVRFQHPKCAMFLAILVYINFFTHHFIGDFRWLLAVLLILCFWRTKIICLCYSRHVQLPVWLCFMLLGGIIWVGENIATFYGAWQYPNQHTNWQLVHVGKVGSWGLLVIVTFVIINFFQQKYNQTNTQGILNS